MQQFGSVFLDMSPKYKYLLTATRTPYSEILRIVISGSRKFYTHDWLELAATHVILARSSMYDQTKRF